jgi:hypothetical protein
LKWSKENKEKRHKLNILRKNDEVWDQVFK